MTARFGDVTEKWCPKFGQACKVDSALMRKLEDDGEATEFVSGGQGEDGAGGDPWRRYRGGAVGALASSFEAPAAAAEDRGTGDRV